MDTSENELSTPMPVTHPIPRCEEYAAYMGAARIRIAKKNRKKRYR
jgi:hypothetical protein